MVSSIKRSRVYVRDEGLHDRVAKLIHFMLQLGFQGFGDLILRQKQLVELVLRDLGPDQVTKALQRCERPTQN